jgi:hypothetical protein
MEEMVPNKPKALFSGDLFSIGKKIQNVCRGGVEKIMKAAH